MKLYIDLNGNITKTEEVGLISGSWGNNFIDFYYQGNVTYASINAIRADSFHIKNLIIPATKRMYDTEQGLYFWRYEVEENDPLISVAGQLELSINFIKLVTINDLAEKESVIASVSYVTFVKKSVGSQSEEEYNDFLAALEQYTDQILATNDNVAINKSDILQLTQALEILYRDSAKIVLSGKFDTIDEKTFSLMQQYGNKGIINYNFEPYTSLCAYLYEDENEVLYRGVVVSREKGLQTLTIAINKETRKATYTFDNNLSAVENDISALKQNVQKLLDGSVIIQAAGWAKIEGVLIAEEVTALYTTKGTGLYTITSEEFGKEAVIIDTSKQLFKRQTGKYDYIYNFNTNQWELEIQPKLDDISQEFDNIKSNIVDENGNYSLVKGIKGSAETGEYRTGKVVITSADIGTYTKEEIETLVQGRSKGLVIDTESELNTILSDSSYIDKLNVSDNILIKEVEVPDYWITETSSTLRGFNGTEIINETDYNNGWRGYFCISPLETQKVDLSEYQKITDVNLKTDSKEIVGAINEVREYSNANPTTIAVGGIAKGTTFDSVPITEVIDRLLYPYVAFSLGSFTTSPSGGVFEVGTSKFITSCTVYINYGTAKITKIEILDSSNNVLATKTDIEQTATSGESFNISLNYTITTNQALKARVTDSAGTVKTASSSSFTFVNPYYYGVISDGVELTESLITGLTKLVVTKGGMTRTYTMVQQKAVLAYPASYGSLSKILDENSFNVTETFTQNTVTINDVSYYVYVLNSPATSTMKYTFSY